MFRHLKKRNTGLLTEFFSRYMALAIIDKKDTELDKAKDIFLKHFTKGTDLYKELKVFRALNETKLDSKESARSLIEQAKAACKAQSQTKLDLEKTALLHEINKSLNNTAFFNQEIPKYQDFATIQVLMNHWRGDTVVCDTISEVVQLEDKLINHIVSRTETLLESTQPPSSLNLTREDIDGLVVNLMTKKLNQKFSSSLNETQKRLVQLYVFSKDNPQSKTELTTLLESLKSKALQVLNTTVELKNFKEKLTEVRFLIAQPDWKDTSNPNDKMITFYMTLSKLSEELENSSNE